MRPVSVGGWLSCVLASLVAVGCVADEEPATVVQAETAQTESDLLQAEGFVRAGTERYEQDIYADRWEHADGTIVYTVGDERIVTARRGTYTLKGTWYSTSTQPVSPQCKPSRENGSLTVELTGIRLFEATARVTAKDGSPVVDDAAGEILLQLGADRYVGTVSGPPCATCEQTESTEIELTLGAEGDVTRISVARITRPSGGTDANAAQDRYAIIASADPCTVTTCRVAGGKGTLALESQPAGARVVDEGGSEQICQGAGGVQLGRYFFPKRAGDLCDATTGAYVRLDMVAYYPPNCLACTVAPHATRLGGFVESIEGRAVNEALWAENSLLNTSVRQSWRDGVYDVITSRGDGRVLGFVRGWSYGNAREPEVPACSPVLVP